MVKNVLPLTSNIRYIYIDIVSYCSVLTAWCRCLDNYHWYHRFPMSRCSHLVCRSTSPSLLPNLISSLFCDSVCLEHIYQYADESSFMLAWRTWAMFPIHSRLRTWVSTFPWHRSSKCKQPRTTACVVQDPPLSESILSAPPSSWFWWSQVLYKYIDCWRCELFHGINLCFVDTHPSHELLCTPCAYFRFQIDGLLEILRNHNITHQNAKSVSVQFFVRVIIGYLMFRSFMVISNPLQQEAVPTESCLLCCVWARWWVGQVILHSYIAIWRCYLLCLSTWICVCLQSVDTARESPSACGCVALHDATSKHCRLWFRFWPGCVELTL